uniref:Uncharacterized protein n=1 Tax=Schistocephalus solidus TaxID=70667 RepID=A0A0X3PTE4_SCHSO
MFKPSSEPTMYRYASVAFTATYIFRCAQFRLWSYRKYTFLFICAINRRLCRSRLFWCNAGITSFSTTCRARCVIILFKCVCRGRMHWLYSELYHHHPIPYRKRRGRPVGVV